MKTAISLVSILCVLILSSCSSAATNQANSGKAIPSTASVYTPATAQVPGYPSVQETTAYPFPGSNQTDISSEPTWTLEPNTGIVTGVLLLNDKPVKNIRLYLGDIISTKSGQDISAAVDPATSPTTFTDGLGNFTFLNVKMGRYSLILNNAINSYIIDKPGTQMSFIIEVTPNGKIELGNLNYQDLPIAQK